MMRRMKRVRVIGIAGGSCSGKSSVARRVCELRAGGATLFALDAYYHDQSGKTIDEINVDVPGALDADLIIRHVASLRAGDAVDQPAYDYTTHARAAHTHRLEPAGVIVVEGLYALYWPELRDLLDLKVFIAASHDTCIARRVARDTRERGRSAAEVGVQYQRDVEPMYELHVHPTRKHADLTIDGERSPDELATAIIESLPDQDQD